MILSRQIRCLLADPIAAAAHVPDRYRKHFTASAHLWLLVLHGLSGNTSLRQTHAMVAADPTFWDRLGLPDSAVSRSQLAQSSTSRPRTCFETLFTTLRDQLPRTADRRIHLYR